MAAPAPSGAPAPPRAPGERRAPRIDVSSEAFKRDPLPRLRALREAGPVVPARLPLLGELGLVTTWDACTEVLKDADRFCVDGRNAGRGRFDAFRVPIPRIVRVLAENMLGLDDPDHRRLRDLVERAFRRSTVDDLRPQIRRAADGLLDEIEADLSRARGGGDRAAPSVDLLDRYARRVPLVVISDLLGLPPEDRESFWRWVHPLVSDPSPLRLLFGLRGLRRLMRYLQAEIERRRRDPREGLISALVDEAAGGETSEDELVSMVFLLLVAGHETTTHLLAGGVLELLRHPEQRAALEADWSQAPAAVDELLRYVSPVQSTKPRYAREATEVGGTPIAKGQVLLPFIAAANADPARFDAPERLDLGRAPNPHLAFGTGRHSCLGLQLARAEGEIALERLFRRFPGLALGAPEGALRYTTRLGVRALRSLPVAPA